jgi:hypothetical protein
MDRTQHMPASSDPALVLHFGALAPKLGYQIATQGFQFVRINVRHAQRDADAVTRLLVRGLISERAGETARQKILRDVTRSVKP